MKHPKFRPATVSGKTVTLYLALFCAMVLFNYALPQHEPLSFALFFAALACGLQPLICGVEYLLSSLFFFSLPMIFSAAVQASFLTLVYCIYQSRSAAPKRERYAYALLAQLPFLFLFPHTGYAYFPFSTIVQKCFLAALLLLFSLLSEAGLRALLFRAFRCRLPVHALGELCALWCVLGMGLYAALGKDGFLFVALFCLLAAVLLLKNAAAVPFSVVLSLPLCLSEGSVLPLAEFALYACLALLLVPYGKTAAALTLFFAFLLAEYTTGLFSLSPFPIAIRLLSCVLPSLLLVCLPEKLFSSLRKSLLFYREQTLPRMAINRGRRVVGERLYEVSALFREIEASFSQEEDLPSDPHLGEAIRAQLCKNCPNRTRCNNLAPSIDKLVAVGCAKGKVSLVDLPADLSSRCSNSAGLLFLLNQQLADYRTYLKEIESVRESRNLLADQARGVSDILRDMALELSEEVTVSEDTSRLSAAFATAGIIVSELFVYGEGNRLTVSVSVLGEIPGKTLCAVAGEALGVPLSLAEKIPIAADRVCCILRRKATYDAVFGVASIPKAGESMCGDTHSVLRIDERSFLLALSDGMGSGETAHCVSGRTLSLLESCYKAKMPSQIVLNAVNRLIAVGQEETFSCLDLAAVNLDTGDTDVVKIGSPAGFVLSGNQLKVLEGGSLPMGMLDIVHPATIRINLHEDDFLLFMSDGVSSAFGSSAELYDYLSTLHPLNPQNYCEEILSQALALSGGKAQDDMTVLALRLLEAA